MYKATQTLWLGEFACLLLIYALVYVCVYACLLNALCVLICKFMSQLLETTCQPFCVHAVVVVAVVYKPKYMLLYATRSYTYSSLFVYMCGFVCACLVFMCFYVVVSHSRCVALRVANKNKKPEMRSCCIHSNTHIYVLTYLHTRISIHIPTYRCLLCGRASILCLSKADTYESFGYLLRNQKME